MTAAELLRQGGGTGGQVSISAEVIRHGDAMYALGLQAGITRGLYLAAQSVGLDAKEAILRLMMAHAAEDLPANAGEPPRAKEG